MWLKAGILSDNPKRVCLSKVWIYLESQGRCTEDSKGGKRKTAKIEKTCESRSFWVNNLTDAST